MAATLAEIRAGIVTNLEARLTGVQISPYMLASPTPPTLQVMGPEETNYDLAMQRGLDAWQIVIQGFVGGITDRGAQTLLDEWLAPDGAKSVKKAVEIDPTFSGKIVNARVVSASGYRIYNLDNRAPALGAEWTVTVHNTGK